MDALVLLLPSARHQQQVHNPHPLLPTAQCMSFKAPKVHVHDPSYSGRGTWDKLTVFHNRCTIKPPARMLHQGLWYSHIHKLIAVIERVSGSLSCLHERGWNAYG